MPLETHDAPDPPVTAPRMGKRPHLFSQHVSRRSVLLGLAGLAITGNAVAGFTLAPKTYTYQGHTATIMSVAWSPDGSRLASCSEDGTVQVWEPFTGKRLFTYRLPDSSNGEIPTGVSWAPDSRRIVFALGLQFQISDIITGKTLASVQTQSQVNVVAWSPDGSKIATGENDYSGGVHIWDSTSGKRIYTYLRQKIAITALAWSPDSQRVVSASGDQTTQVWDATTGQHVVIYHHIPIPDPYIPTDIQYDAAWAVTWSPDASRIASGYTEGGAIQVWEAATGKRLLSIGNTIYQGITILSLAWSPNGKQIVSGGGAPKVWDATTGEHIYTYNGHVYPGGSYNVRSVAWSPNGDFIASAGADKTVQIWSAP